MAERGFAFYANLVTIRNCSRYSNSHSYIISIGDCNINSNSHIYTNVNFHTADSPHHYQGFDGMRIRNKINMQSLPTVVANIRKNFLVLAIRINLVAKKYDEAISLLNFVLNKWAADPKLLDVAQQTYAESQRWDDFYRLHTQVAEMHPNNPLLRRYLGTSFVSGYRFEDAVPHFVACIQNWNLDDSYSHVLGNTYARLAICYAHMGNREDMGIALRKAEDLTSWDPDIGFAHLLEILGTKNVANIGEFLDQQLEEHPRLHALYFWKGLHVQYYLRDSREAIRWYELALKKISSLRPGRDYWRDYLSTMAYAIPGHTVKRAIEACIEAGNYLKAFFLIYYSKFTIWDSGIDTQILTTYLNILRNRNSIAESKCKLMLTRRLSAFKRTEYSFLLALALTRQGKLDEGLSNIEQTLKLNSEKIEAWTVLGSIQMIKKDWQSAIHTFRKMVSMNRFDFRYWQNLGLCYRSIGDESSAKHSYKQVVQLNPFEADTWVELANIHMVMGEKDLAFSAYKNGLKFDWLSSERRQQALQAIQGLEAS